MLKTKHVLSANKKYEMVDQLKKNYLENYFITIISFDTEFFFLEIAPSTKTKGSKRSLDFGSKELGDLHSTPFDGSIEVHIEIEVFQKLLTS